jgi:hypothetical protein
MMKSGKRKLFQRGVRNLFCRRGVRNLFCRMIVGVIILFCSIPVSGTQTEIWETSSFDEFQRGELDNVSLTRKGEIMLAPQLAQVLKLEDRDLFVWALVEDSKGNLYAGTGEQGRIFKITPAGEVSLFFDSPEIGIMSLAVDAGNNVYAGSAPDGLIYKITPEGSQTTLFSTGEHYVWALVCDSDGVLYAGTGESGKIFKVLPDGTGSLLYDSQQSHIMSLLYDEQGWLYAGTEGKGVTYKVGLDGSVFSLYSAEEEEIHALAFDSQGNLYIAAISNQFYPKAQTPEPAEQPQPRPKEKRRKKSSIYRINPDGTVRKILELPEALIYAMIVDADDRLFVGTDEKAMLYRVFSDGEYHQVLTMETGSILSLLKDPSGQIYAGTGDPGTVYRLAARPVEQGSYLSTVHNVETTATWGKIFWRGTANQIALLTRTGNTEVPDDTWSPWSEELHNKEGDTIPNPPARFIQWKAIFTSQEQQNPVLEEVSVAYLPNNLAPEIEEVGIYHGDQEEPIDQNSSGNSAPSPSRNSQREDRPQKTGIGVKPPKHIPPGYVAIVWDAEDPNDEALFYTVSLRGEELKWQVLKEELEIPLYLLDTSTLPDGNYYVKVTATDTPNNPPDRALTAEKVSERFEIDNTAPEISIALNQKQGNEVVLVTVIAIDDFSRLRHAEYSLDADEWISIFPDDEVTDSREEKYSITLPDLTMEDHVLAFKAIDAHDNIGVAKFVFSPQSLQPSESPQEQPQEEAQQEGQERISE